MRNLLGLALLLCSQVFSQNITDGLLLQYEFDNNYNDISGNGFHGMNFGTIFTDDRNGVPNSAVYFDGINDYINFPNVLELKPDLPLSFSFWIRYDSDNSSDRDVFNTSFEEDHSSGVYFNSQQSTGNYAVNFGDGSNSYLSSTRRTFVVNESIVTGVWHHVVIVVNSALDMKIYVDCGDKGGIYSGSGGDLVYSSLPGTLGRHDRDLNSPANYFNGAIDDFMYWDRALSNEEVNQLCLLGVLEFNLSDLVIYPNPTNGELNIKANNTPIDAIKLFNSLGQKVLDQDYQDKINIKELPKGIYFIHLIKGENIEIRKIIKNN